MSEATRKSLKRKLQREQETIELLVSLKVILDHLNTRAGQVGANQTMEMRALLGAAAALQPQQLQWGFCAVRVWGWSPSGPTQPEKHGGELQSCQSGLVYLLLHLSASARRRLQPERRQKKRNPSSDSSSSLFLQCFLGNYEVVSSVRESN